MRTNLHTATHSHTHTHRAAHRITQSQEEKSNKTGHRPFRWGKSPSKKIDFSFDSRPIFLIFFTHNYDIAVVVLVIIIILVIIPLYWTEGKWTEKKKRWDEEDVGNVQLKNSKQHFLPRRCEYYIWNPLLEKKRIMTGKAHGHRQKRSRCGRGDCVTVQLRCVLLERKGLIWWYSTVKRVCTCVGQRQDQRCSRVWDGGWPSWGEGI